jgi:Ca2+-binding RTX toxin-like protein
MATINASTGADIIVPSNNGTTYRGLEGNDTYIISNAIAANAKVTIVDTSGTDTIQLVDGLSISSSKFAGDSVQLTLSNGAVVTVNNADKFTFEVGGNETAGVTGSSKTYAELASAMGVATLPTGSTISDGTSGSVTGSSISGAAASSYSLSADATSVAEGGSITYTVTANAAVSSDTALTYNVRGSDNSGSVDKASGADVNTQSGTVTILSGSSSATFTITATADNVSEGLEGISVSVFDNDLNVIGSKTALISNNQELETTATNLTTANDAVTGGGGKDTIGAQIGTNGATTATTFTYNPGDTIDGGAGNDTLKISKSGTNTAGQTYTGVEISNVENFEVSNFDAGVSTFSDTFDFSLITGVTTAGLTSSSTTDIAGDTVFSNVAVLFDEVILKNGGGGLTVTYNTATIAGANTQNVLLSGTTATADLTLASIETVNVTGGAVKSTLAALTTADATTINFDGDTTVSVTAALEGGATTIDASANTAGVTVTLNPDSATGTTFTGSAAADSVTMSDNALTQLTSINGGAGNDTIAFSDAADITILTGPMVSGFETLRALASETSEDYDVSLIPGITALQAIAPDTASKDVMFRNTSGTESLTVLGTDGAGITLAVDGSADAVTVTYVSATGTSVAVGSNGGTNLAQFETINIVSAGVGVTANTGALTIGSANSIVVTGAYKMTLGASSSTVLTSVDASGMTGTASLVMGTNAGTALFPQTIIGTGGNDTLIGADGADTITGGAGNDIINGAESTDTIIGGAGNDTLDGDAGADILSGGAGNDIFSVDDDADFVSLASPEVVDGGDGTDTLLFSEDATVTLANTDTHGLKDVEVLKFNGDAAVAVTLDDTFFTNNGATSIIIDDNEGTAALTVSAGTVSAANSLDVRLNSNTGINENITGGAGDDIFKIDTIGNAAALDGSDIINGGKGTDTLAITVAGNNLTSATMSGISAIEKITLTAVNAETAGFVLATSTFVTTAIAPVTGIVDASSWTGTGALTFDGALETDSKMEITGGNGPDVLTGGSKADTIIGGLGADTILGGDGIDTLDGGAGNDIFTVDDVSDFIGLTSAETVIGGAGVADILVFSEAATTIVAASDLANISGIEQISLTGTGANTLTLSNDVFAGNGSTTLTILDGATGGASTVSAGGLSAANSISYKNIAASSTVDSVTAGAGDDSFTTFEDSLAATDVFAGGAGSDTLTIKLDGGNLSDLTLGATNIEIITVTTDASARTAAFTLADTNFASVAGVINAQTMTGGLTLDADLENDSSLTITTGIGADNIIGTDEAKTGDTISTGTGADTIEGSKGGDTISGGAGADDFVLNAVADSSGTTPDTYTDFVTGVDEFNVTADYSANNAPVTINATVLTGAASKAAAQETLTGQRLEVIYNTADNVAYINYNADNLITSLDYTLNINVGATPLSTLQSKDFNFTITGTASGDTVVSGAGDDNLSGGEGNDALNAGTGINIIATGAGNDQVTNTQTGVDTITLTSGSDDVGYSTVGDVASSLVTLTSATAPDFIATAGVTVDSILSFTSATDEIDILGALNAAIDADGDISDTAVLVANGADLDYDAGGVHIIGGTQNNAGDDLVGNNFGDVSDVIAIFNNSNGTAANATANDEILFAIENLANTQWGLYYLKDVDGNGDIGSGDQLALIAILTTNALVVADFNFV